MANRCGQCLQDQEAEIDAEIARLDALKDTEMFIWFRVTIRPAVFFAFMFCGQEDDLEELRRKRLEQMKSAHSESRRSCSSTERAWDATHPKLNRVATAAACEHKTLSPNHL